MRIPGMVLVAFCGCVALVAASYSRLDRRETHSSPGSVRELVSTGAGIPSPFGRINSTGGEFRDDPAAGGESHTLLTYPEESIPESTMAGNSARAGPLDNLQEPTPSASQDEPIPHQALQSTSAALRRLQRLHAKYHLAPAQLAKIYPAVAKATGSTGSSLAQEAAAVSTSAPDAAEDESGFAEILAEAVGQTASTATASPGKSSAKDPAMVAEDPFETALNASLDALEDQLAALLTPEQLAILDEEQIDRYYWWGEILIQLAGAADEEAAIIAIALQPTSPATTGSSASDPNAVPTDHLGGNLFDLPGTQPPPF